MRGAGQVGRGHGSDGQAEGLNFVWSGMGSP